MTLIIDYFHYLFWIVVFSLLVFFDFEVFSIVLLE